MRANKKINAKVLAAVTAKRSAFTAMLSLAYVCSVSAGSGDPTARLHAARSLQCTYTSAVNTWVRPTGRTVEESSDKDTVTYDNIDTAKGTARIVANGGAGDLKVWIDNSGGALWMLEFTPAHNVNLTTVFPRYAAGTNAFIVLESRHTMAMFGQTVLGEQSYGTCKVLD